MEERIRQALELAKKLGFTHTAPLKREDFVSYEAVRDMCGNGKCNVFGKSWACPPACGTLAECAGRLDGYRAGILVQSVGEVEDSFDIEGMFAEEKAHKERFYALIDALRSPFPGLFPLGAGACKLCASCAYPEKCRFPDSAVSSMEAYGGLITEITGKCGLQYNYGPGSIAFTSCVFLL